VAEWLRRWSLKPICAGSIPVGSAININIMKIWIHKAGGRWYHYFIPTWLNTITRKAGEPKIYRWLFWGYEKKIDENNLEIRKL
jgi:hypothetical protein